jgi:hypothetical protein
MTRAQKAARTRKARKELKETYGAKTATVLRGLEQGHNDLTIMWSASIDDFQLAAYKANLTRGTYDHLLFDCNF